MKGPRPGAIVAMMQGGIICRRHRTISIVTADFPERGKEKSCVTGTDNNGGGALAA